jgi:hypothetical protein
VAPVEDGAGPVHPNGPLDLARKCRETSCGTDTFAPKPFGPIHTRPNFTEDRLI